jgi:sialate O-acetylesterase
MVDEIEMANVMLNIIDGKTKRTFAYPCGEKMAGDSSYVPYIKNFFVGARSVDEVSQKITEIDLFDIGSYMINGQTGDQLISLVEEALNRNALIVFLFHGVGGEHSLDVSLNAHNKLLHFLKLNDEKIWVAPLVEIADYIKEFRTTK